MPGCSHSHAAEKADKWTKIAGAGEAVTSFVSDAYWLASSFQLATGFEEEAMGLSYYALGFGFMGAVLSASGATYCHYMLNKAHQHAHPPEKESSSGTAMTTVTTHDEDTRLLPRANRDVDDFGDDDTETSNLTCAQKLALLGDFIAHTGDNAGPLTFVVDLATGGGLPTWAKLATQSGATLFAGLSAVAGVRTCKNAIQEANAVHTCPGQT